jgi:hypothetical protein
MWTEKVNFYDFLCQTPCGCADTKKNPHAEIMIIRVGEI